MKWSTSVALALAPLALARKVQNTYGRRGMQSELDGRSLALMNGMEGRGITANSRTEVIIIWINPGSGSPTTKINDKVTITKTVTAGGEGAAATPATHTVKVGGPGGLTFQPDQLNNVPVGDTVVFEFLSQNHTVSQSPFDTPCKKLEGGMDSGFQANPNNTITPPPQVAMQVMSEKPLWFYCRQKGHCGKGMVFSLNPTAEKTHAKFQALAIEQSGNGQSTPITGGDKPADKPAGETPPAEGAPSGSPSAAPPAESSAPAPPAGGDGATPGKGTVGADGSCTCFVQCAAGGFPAVNAQGVGSYGGFGGGLPMAAM